MAAAIPDTQDRLDVDGLRAWSVDGFHVAGYSPWAGIHLADTEWSVVAGGAAGLGAPVDGAQAYAAVTHSADHHVPAGPQPVVQQVARYLALVREVKLGWLPDSNPNPDPDP
jgi:hypothetical protein